MATTKTATPESRVAAAELHKRQMEQNNKILEKKKPGRPKQSEAQKAENAAKRALLPKDGSSGKQTKIKLLQKRHFTASSEVIQAIRKDVQKYLNTATGPKSREHEKRRQSEDILDAINAKAKELVKMAKSEGRAIKPVDALKEAETLVASSFEDYLKKEFHPALFELFGFTDTADTAKPNG